MAIVQVNTGAAIQELIGLSTDIKPMTNVKAGAMFTESDTGKQFKFSGIAWFPLVVQTAIIGSLPKDILAEPKTEADAVVGVLTFSENILIVEIYNTDTTNAGVFTVNGIDITIPAGKPWKDAVGGTPSPTITVTGATTYIVNRYE